MHKLVTVSLIDPYSGGDPVAEHLTADLSRGWKIISVTGIPIADDPRAYAFLAVVLSNDNAT